MPEPTQADLSDLEGFRYWKPEAQERALELLRQRRDNPWRPFYCKNPECDGNPHGEWQFHHARVDQRPPKWTEDWLIWFLMGGRGSGKTRTGAETTNRATAVYPRLVLIGATGPDLRETMVEGVSGILTTAHPDNRPTWEPSRKRLVWPNGCIGQGFSAEEPDRLRGPESGFIWADEPAHWPLVQEAWDNALFGHRMKGKHGLQPKAVMTSTPKATAWVKETAKAADTVVRRVSTYANMVNLAEKFRERILARYEGTRLGKQELHGEILEDVEGALWSWTMIRTTDVAPRLRRIVVGVDPAGTANKRSDITGIIVVGIGYDGMIYVLDDLSGKYGPSEWATKVVEAHEFWNADAIVAEKNYGGDMVEETIRNSAERQVRRLAPRIIMVTSRRGKDIRAEPVVAIYEKGRAWHVGPREVFAELENEQTSWVPNESPSPNRIDAEVHAVTELGGKGGDSTFADPSVLVPAGPTIPGQGLSTYVSSQSPHEPFTRVNGYGIYVP